MQYPGLRNKNVAIGNALTRAAQSLTLAEKRLIFSAIAKGAGRQSKVKITAVEYGDTFDIPPNQAYEQLKEASKNIFDRYITLHHSDGIDEDARHFRWVEAGGYKKDEGYVTLVFTNSVLPYLLDLEDKFTKYKLGQACALRSIYSWRLLELFEQHSSGKLFISLKDFHHAMEAPEKYRSQYSDTRTKIIQPAIDELVKKDNWEISWEPDKKGTRAVQQLRFSFKRRE